MIQISQLKMEELLTNYVRDKNMEIPALREAVKSTQPAQLLQLLLTIKEKSNTAVMIAANEGHREVFFLLLSPLKGTSDELLWVKEEKLKATVLHIAAVMGDSEWVELLLDTVSADRKYDFAAEKNDYGNTALAVAAGYGNSQSVKSILYNFSSLQRNSLLKIQNRYLYTPLHNSAFYGHT